MNLARQQKDARATLAEEAELFEKHKDDSREARDYAKPLPPRRPAQVYSVRIPVDRLAQLKTLADSQDVAPSTMIREWVLERLDSENDPSTLETIAEEAAKATARLKSAIKTNRRSKKAS